MDHYKVLGIPKSASKEEIKDSFRKLAMKFHPDKHSQSPKSVKDGATVKFKQVSEAYEVLMDDHKRANYDQRRGSFHGNRRAGGGYGSSSYSGGSYGYNGGGNDYYGGGRYYKYGRSQGVNRFQLVFQYTKTRAFLLNLAFASILLGGTYVVEVARDRLWKMQNSGKSFEAAIETIEKAKADRDDN